MPCTVSKMVLVQESPYQTEYIIYDAPVNEKTKEIRKKFNIDEETGYPDCYKWRNLARLGRTYKYDDPFVKFDSHSDEKDYSQNVLYASIFGAIPWVYQGARTLLSRRSFFYRIYLPILATPVVPALYFFMHKKSLERQAMRNGILVDYVRKHPERFGEVYRPKFREILFEHSPRY